MKRRIYLSLSFCMVAVLVVTMALPVLAAYPGSVGNGVPAPSAGKILTGEFIGTEGYGGSETSDYKAAFDGDVITAFDPTGIGDDKYAGVKLDQSYILTEIRIHPRSTWLTRFEGATIQGSNDGVNWTTLWVSEAAAPEVNYVIITDVMLSNNTGWSQYRYVNNLKHGDVAEIEFWGISVAEAASETSSTSSTASTTTTTASSTSSSSPKTGDNTFIFAIISVVAAAVLFGIFLNIKKRTDKI